MAEQYFRPVSTGAGLYKEKGSKFISRAHPANSLESIHPVLNELKKEYYDARHHCYAYSLGANAETTFANDDREPAHSAGDPILAAIRAHYLTDIIIVVIRYFGGTKLGIRGLIEAYRTAAELSIQSLNIEPIIAKVQFSLAYEYHQTSEINKILHKFNPTIISQEYTETCHQTFWIKEDLFSPLKAQLLDSGYLVDQVKSFD